jgi:hypothetical protein
MESIVASVLVLAVTSFNASFGIIRPRQQEEVVQNTPEVVATNENITFIKPLRADCEPVKLIREYTNYHVGIDYISETTINTGTHCIIVAAANGEIVYADWSSNGEGYMVKIKHNNNLFTEYFHGDGKFYVKVGDRVTQGQDIMNMGATGNATGTHLHFAVNENGAYVDPIGFII